MKRALTVFALAAAVAAPAGAQWAGMPVWNSPKGGTGVTINGDFGKPNADLGKGSAFGGRATLGLGSLSVTAGMSSWKPSGASSSATSLGATAAFRVIGGSLIPLNINLLVGGARTTADSVPNITTIVAGGGVSVSLPTPGVSIEPYLSITERVSKLSGISGTNSNIGFTIGANASFGLFGIHLAYDRQKLTGGGTGSVIGIGAHVALKVPLGM
jgi:hypothetical protein